MALCSVPLVPTMQFLAVPNVTGLFVLNVIPMADNIAVGREAALHEKN